MSDRSNKLPSTKPSWVVRVQRSRSYFMMGVFSLSVRIQHSVFTVTSELVMLSLDLVKTRLSVMSMEMRKNFIQVILTSLIEKSPDPKILRAVVKIVEEWVKNNSPMAANQVMGWSPLMNFAKE